MHVLILGGAGMIGRKLSAELLKTGKLNGAAISRLTLADVIKPEKPLETIIPRIEAIEADISRPGEAARVASLRPDVVFHLAAIVSGEAEANLEKGYTINLDGTRALLDALRRKEPGSGPLTKVVFASSIAVFGGNMPDFIPDDYYLTPETSYGAQKAMSELMLADYTRRGLIDGIGIRLPTICVRPGKPNLAASGFFSGIIREPLIGQEAILPVADTVRHWFASPRSAVQFFLHAASLTPAQVGLYPNLTMPGVSATVAEQIEALRRAAGDKAVALIKREPNEVIARIVSGWARGFNPARATSLGFKAETSFDQIIEAHIEDELATSAQKEHLATS